MSPQQPIKPEAYTKTGKSGIIEELVEQLRENPYYQYFIRMPGYEDKYLFVPSLLAELRKRLSEEILSEVDEIIISSAMSEKIEKLIDKICYDFNYYTPRMYREKARKDYLSLAKCKKRPAKRIRKAVKATPRNAAKKF